MTRYHNSSPRNGRQAACPIGNVSTTPCLLGIARSLRADDGDGMPLMMSRRRASPSGWGQLAICPQHGLRAPKLEKGWGYSSTNTSQQRHYYYENTSLRRFTSWQCYYDIMCLLVTHNDNIILPNYHKNIKLCDVTIHLLQLLSENSISIVDMSPNYNRCVHIYCKLFIHNLS